MWEYLFNDEVLQKIIDEYLYEDETETLETMRKAIEHFSAFVDYEEAIRLALDWNNLSEIVKVDVSVVLVDAEEASRFMIVMDYLSDQLRVEGEPI